MPVQSPPLPKNRTCKEYKEYCRNLHLIRHLNSETLVGIEPTLLKLYHNKKRIGQPGVPCKYLGQADIQQTGSVLGGVW